MVDADYQQFSEGDLPPELQILKLKMDESEREYHKLQAEKDNIKRNTIYPPSIESILQQVKQAEAKVENTEFEFNKNRYLFSVGAISRNDYEDSRAEYEISKSELNAYRANLQEGKETHHYDTLSAKDAFLKAKEEYEVQLKEFVLKYDQKNYDTMIADAEVSQVAYEKDTYNAQKKENEEKLVALEQKQSMYLDKQRKLTLTAPLTGILIEDKITDKIGKHFDLGEKICEIAGLEKILVNVLVDEKDIGDVKLEYPVRLKVKPFMGSLFKGQVYKISPVSSYDEAKKRNFYSVELIIDNPEDKLKPGMTGYAKINCGSRPIIVLILREIGHLVRSEYWFF